MATAKEAVLLVRQRYDPITRLEWMKVDLATKKLTKSSTRIGTTPKKVFLEATGVASLGRKVIIFGGHEFSEGNRPSGQVHILDPAAKTWKQAANMGRARGSAAYGVIDGKLYVAGGFAGSDVGWLDYTEVYDPGSNSWTELSSMPEAGVMIQLFCVWKGKLWLRGSKLPEGTRDFRQKESFAWSFCPATNVWKDEAWLLQVLDMPELWSYKLAVATGDETVYMARAEKDARDPDYVCKITVKKLDAGSLKWIAHTVYQDMAEGYNCECSFDTDVTIHGLQDGVLIVDHLDDDEDCKVRKKKAGLVRLSVNCPSNWATAVISS